MSLARPKSATLIDNLSSTLKNTLHTQLALISIPTILYILFTFTHTFPSLEYIELIQAIMYTTICIDASIAMIFSNVS